MANQDYNVFMLAQVAHSIAQMRTPSTATVKTVGEYLTEVRARFEKALKPLSDCDPATLLDTKQSG